MGNSVSSITCDKGFEVQGSATLTMCCYAGAIAATPAA